MPKHEIQSVAFGEDGSVQVTYLTPETDAKKPGLVRAHTLVVPLGADYDDEIEAIADAARYLIDDVNDDWDRLPKLERDDQATTMP